MYIIAHQEPRIISVFAKVWQILLVVQSPALQNAEICTILLSQSVSLVASGGSVGYYPVLSTRKQTAPGNKNLIFTRYDELNPNWECSKEMR